MIELSQTFHSFPGFTVGPVDLQIQSGDFFILLGPTGSGKTVLLESIAGLRQPSSGKILIDGKDITSLPPEKRQIGIVYQDQALFPHLSVLENINFGLKYFNSTKSLNQYSLDTIIETLGLGTHLAKSINDLSGGERQRVALARALAIQPRVLLLDEPLSALDPCFRGEIQQLLKRLHGAFNITFMMVTHDFNEAFFLGEHIGVIINGTLKQTGTVSELFLQPNDQEVAKFVGMKNIFRISKDKKCMEPIVGDNPNDNVQEYHLCGLRPEDIEVKKTNSFPADYHAGKGIVQVTTRQGFSSEINLISNGINLYGFTERGSFRNQSFMMGEEIYFGFHPEALHIFF